MNEPRNTIVTVELIQDSEIKPDPLEIMWAAHWQLNDLINRLALNAYTSVDIIHHQKFAAKPDEKQSDRALRVITNATQAIRNLSVMPLYNMQTHEPKQITFVYMGAMYGVTVATPASKIEESN